MLRRLRRYLVHKLTFKLLPLIQADDVLTFNQFGQVLLNGKPLAPAKVTELIEDCKYFQQSETWRLLQVQVNRLAKQLLWEKSQTPDDVMVAKVMLYNLEVQRELVKKILKAKPAVTTASSPLAR